MKKYLVIILLILIPIFTIWADKEDFLVGYIYTPEGYTWFGIKATALDTSEVFDTREVMSVKFWGADTTGNNDVDIDFTFQTSPFESGHFWTTQKTYTLDADSSAEDLLLTESAISSDPFGRFILEGGAANSATDSVVVEIAKSFYPRVQKNSR